MNEVYKMSASSKDEVNNAINYILHFGHPSDDDLWVRLLILGKLIHEPCFDTLRTQEQLGYIVGASSMLGTSYMGLKISIQSSFAPDYLEKRIELFLEKFEQLLVDMDIEGLKKGISAEHLQDYKSQSEETGFYWSEILGRYDFFYGQRIAALVSKITKRDVVDTYMTYVHPQGSKRSKLSIQLYAQQVDTKPIMDLLRKYGVKHGIKGKMLVDDLKKAVEEAAKDLPFAAGLEIMRTIEEMDILDGISASELKKRMPLGEPLKPVAEYYDGVLSKL